MAVGISSTLARDMQNLENVTRISLSQLARDDSIGTFMVHEAHLMVMAVFQCMQSDCRKEFSTKVSVAHHQSVTKRVYTTSRVLAKILI
jgi:DNA repair protein RadC